MKRIRTYLMTALLLANLGGGLYAGVDEFRQSGGSPGHQAFVVSNQFTMAPNWGTNYTYNSVKNYVVLEHELDHASLYTEAFDVEVDVSISKVDLLGATTVLPLQTLSLHIDPASGAIENHLHAYKFDDAKEFTFSIISINVTSTSGTLTWNDVKTHFYIDGGSILDRYIPITTGANPWPDFLGFDFTHDEVDDEIKFKWASLDEAEEYQLEWMWIDDQWPTYTDAKYLDIDGDGDIDKNDIVIDFRKNATRVSTALTEYTIPSTLPSGYIVWRVRPMGYVSGVSYLVPGEWCLYNKSYPTLEYFYTDPDLDKLGEYIWLSHESNLNWDYAITFAEEGKNKMVLNYYDGTLRGRQSLTRQQHASGTNVIVGESVYDHLGRALVTPLPVPVNSLSLEFREDFTLNTNGDPYSYNDFGVPSSGCYPEGAAMSTTSGASKYYSVANDFSGDIHHDLIPDAAGYPFTQTVVSNDHLGRVVAQGGVGPTHKIGSGHETKYMYGKPEQEVLDAVFGNNAGHREYYEETTVIDPNGQVSSSIKDLKGNTVATYLVGTEGANNLSSLTGMTSDVRTIYLKNDLDLAKSDDPIIADPVIEALTISEKLIVKSSQNYTFNYSFEPSQFIEACPENVSDLCFDCVYDLSIELVDDCKNVVWQNSQLTTIGTQNDMSTPATQATQSITPVVLALTKDLEYTLTKTLRLRKSTYYEYLESYFEQNLCLKDFGDFIDAADIEGCDEDEMDCDYCNEVLQGTTLDPQSDAYAQLDAFCSQLCEPDVFCEIGFEQMLHDMKPGLGQYALYEEEWNGPVKDYNASTKPLSVLNDVNFLPGQVLDENGTRKEYRRLNWRNPIGDHYFDESGNIITLDIDNVTYEPQDLTLKQFIEKFQPVWAHTLVKFHPEYNYYIWCRDVYFDAAKTRKRKMLEETDFATANAAGWLDPLEMSGLPGGITASSGTTRDPFFDDDLPASIACGGDDHAPALATKFTNYQAYLDGSTIKFLNIWEFCLLAVTDMTATEADGYDFGQNPLNCDMNKIWMVFRALYMKERDEVARLLQETYAYNYKACNACIGGSPDGLWWDEWGELASALDYVPDYPSFANTYHLRMDYDQPCGQFGTSSWSRASSFAEKERRFPSLAYGAQKMGVDINRSRRDLVNETLDKVNEESDALCESGCRDNVKIWMQKLATCGDISDPAEPWAPNETIYEYVKAELTALCERSCNTINPTGAISDGNMSVNDIIEAATGIEVCTKCNELLLDAPYMGQVAGGQKRLELATIDACGCNKVLGAQQELDARIANDQNYTGTLQDVFQETYGLGIDDIDRALCKCEEAFDLTNNTCWDETVEWNTAAAHFLAESDVPVVPVLNCTDCISCTHFNKAYAAFIDKYDAGLATAVEYEPQFAGMLTGYFNALYNQLWSYDEYAEFFDQCGTITPLVEGRDAHTATGCDVLSDYGVEMQKILEVVFDDLVIVNKTGFAFAKRRIDLNNNILGIAPADFDDILPTGCTQIEIEAKRSLNNQLSVKLNGWYNNTTLGKYQWVNLASLYLTLEEITPSGNPAKSIADLATYAGTLQTVTMVPTFNYTTTGTLMSNYFTVEMEYLNNSVTETFKFSGQNPFYQTSNCITTQLIEDPLVVSVPLFITEWKHLTDGEDCFCDNITEAFQDWEQNNANQTMADFLISEYNPPITNQADADKLLDYLNYWCCNDPHHNERYYAQFQNGNECPPYTLTGFHPDNNSHGQTFDEHFAGLRNLYGTCETHGEGGQGSIPCDVLAFQMEGVLGSFGNHNSTEIDEMVSALLGTSASVVGSNDYLTFTDPCLDCPRPGRMLCSESLEQPDYVDMLDVLLTKEHANQKVYKYNMTSVANFDLYLKPEFDIFTSTLNRSGHSNNTNIEYKLVSESNTELKLKITYDFGTPDVKTDEITLSTCCTTLDFSTIEEVVRFEPAELNNELVFYLYVDAGSCGIIRLKGSSTLFSLSTCCEIGSDICFDKPAEFDPCTSQLTLDGVAKAAKLFAESQQQITNDFKKAYHEQCFANRDQLSYTYTDYSHHYMLYYYDQANNLTMTIPPAGVAKLNTGDIALVNDYRENGNGTPIYPNHTLPTHYQYNATGQVVEQSTPDGGISKFYYDDLGALIASQNAKQLANSDPTNDSYIYSYTVYDALGRPEEVGEKTGSFVITDLIAATDEETGTQNDLTEWYADGDREEVTYTVYDEPKDFSATPDEDDIAAEFGSNGQQNTLFRVTSTYFSEAGDPDVRDFATHYSYDIIGNVHTVVQEIRELEDYGNHFKKIEYTFDLVSGNTHQVWYQKGKLDQFSHKYQYDAENRLVAAKISQDGIFWEQDAQYQYYVHGPLARTTIGDQEVQGVDHAYTIHGWLKSVNADHLQEGYEPGQDGFTTGTHTEVARDVVGFSLGYFNGDYTSIGSSTHLSTDNGSVGNNLYNGNIKHMVTAIQPFMAQHSGSPLMQEYGYDQLNRIVSSVAHVDMNPITRSWLNTSTQTNWQTGFTFDANGNLLTLKRWGDNGLMDDLSYAYHTVNGSASNRLKRVTETVANALYPNDFDISTDDYVYDEIGNLIEDENEDISSIDWTVYGKVKTVNRSSTDKADLAFEYDAGGDRIIKRVKSGGQYQHQYEYYVRDAGGNVIATYTLAADKDYDENFMNYEDFNAELITQKTLADFSTFMQDEFATDPVFKTELKNSVSANDNTQELYDQYSLSDLFTLSNLFYEDALDAYISMDLANLILAQGKTQSIADLYQCDATKLIEALLLEDAAAFITEIDNANPAVTAALCQIHFSGACPNGPAIDLATVNAGTLAIDINAQPSNDIKTAIGQLPNTVIANAIANHTSSTWLADQIVLCGNSTTYQGYLNTDAINAKNHVMNSLGYTAILQRILDNDAAGMIDKVINLGHVYDYISNALANTSTLTMSAYHTMIANHSNYGQITLDAVIAAMQATVTDYELALKLNEHHLYGSSRLGVQKQDLTLWQRNFTGSFTSGLHNYSISGNDELDIPTLDEANFKNRRGSKRFELANHLGNVLAVISDRKIAVDDNSNGQWDYYTADMASAQDYYPFGMQMPGRTYANSSFVDGYRYAFNGKEQDSEWGGNGNMYDYGFRIYNPRIGKFLSVDPLAQDYPELTSYQFAANTPIAAIDLDGLEAVVVVTGITVAKSQDGQTGHRKGQYFMYQVKIYNDMTLDDYEKASKAGTLKQPDATAVLGRDGWNGAPRQEGKYSKNNPAPPGTYWLNYNPEGYGKKKHRLRLSDDKGGHAITGPDGIVRIGIDIHKWSPHDAQGCMTTCSSTRQSEDDFIDLIPSLADGDDVRIILEERPEVWNSDLQRYEGLWNDGSSGNPILDWLEYSKQELNRVNSILSKGEFVDDDEKQLLQENKKMWESEVKSTTRLYEMQKKNDSEKEG